MVIAIREGALVFLIKNRQVLLALIHYPDEDIWSGISGFIDPGEDIKAGAVRELQEEIGVQVSVNDLKEAHLIKMATLNLHIFTTNKWKGEPSPQEGSILQVQWFDFEKIPYEKMKKGCNDWLPNILKAD